MKPPLSSDAHPTRPLSVQRALIDAIDRDILQLLARRNGIVAEVAQYKRQHRVPIRDGNREQQIIEDRRQRSEPLGLSPEVIESIFRLVLWASRDRQAALKAELPLEVESRSVAVIGGRGGMGRALCRLFGDLGHVVMEVDLDTPLTAEEAAEVADVVIVSVPIEVTTDVIRQVGPRVRPEALLTDVTSIKSAPMEAMLDSTDASVLGTHPLFGPSVHSLQGQRIVITPGRGEEWMHWMTDMFRARGLIVTESTPEEHDRAMSVVQVLTHFSTEVLGRTLASLGMSLEQTLPFTSPVYLLDMLMTARHFAQDPDLYASIQMSNPLKGDVTDAFVTAATDLQRIVETNDRDAIRDMFEQVRGFFGNFTDGALEQSSFLIDRLVERS